MDYAVAADHAVLPERVTVVGDVGRRAGEDLLESACLEGERFFAAEPLPAPRGAQVLDDVTPRGVDGSGENASQRSFSASSSSTISRCESQVMRSASAGKVLAGRRQKGHTPTRSRRRSTRVSPRSWAST